MFAFCGVFHVPNQLPLNGIARHSSSRGTVYSSRGGTAGARVSGCSAKFLLCPGGRGTVVPRYDEIALYELSLLSKLMRSGPKGRHFYRLFQVCRQLTTLIVKAEVQAYTEA